MPHWAASLSPSATVAMAAAAAVGVWLAYRIARAVARFLLTPLFHRAVDDHLLEKAPSKRGLVTRNLPRGGRGAGDSDQSPLLPPYPNGWFFVEQSDAISPGQVRHVSMLGLELAVFRDASGQVHALDAYCPHLGANMAIGGQVVSDCLECPFHAWRFRGSDGACQHIPGAKKVPPAARTRSWRVLERSGAILLWHHADDAEPDWYPPQMDEFAIATQMCGRTEHIVYTHIQEIPENGADVAHFEPIHREGAFTGSDLRSMRKGLLSSLVHCWNVISSWRPLDHPDDYMAHFAVQQEMAFKDQKLPFTNVEASVNQVGPALVYLSLSLRALGVRLMLCHYVVPEEPYKQRLTHVMYSPPGVLNRVLGKLFLLGECVMVERDVHIWNNKCLRPKPVLAATSSDEGILRFRRWYSRFYPSSSNHSDEKSDAGARKSLDW